MRSLNKVQLIGNLGIEPDLRFTQSGDAVCNFTLALNESYTNRDGEKVEKTEWVRIVAWRKLAEICSKYLNKGDKVYVEGKLQTREWKDDQGSKRSNKEVVIHDMIMLGGKGNGNSNREDRDSEDDNNNWSDDDIPF